MSFGGNGWLTRTFSSCNALFWVVAVSTLPVVAAEIGATPPIATEAKSRFLALGVGKSVVVDFPGEIKDVLVADPKIANAVVRSARRAYIIGEAIGQTNVVFFDAAGQQVATYDIAVKRDLNGVRAA